MHVNQLPHAFTPSSGHGQCGRVGVMLISVHVTVPVIQRLYQEGRSYFQPGCECDPNCYNEDYSGVSKGGVCEGSLVAEWYSF